MYVLCTERIELLSNKYCKFYVSDILRDCIFGADYDKLKISEVIQKTKRQMIIHIASCAYINSFFLKNSLIRSSKELERRIHACARKADVIKHSMEVVGYILSENGCKSGIKLSNNSDTELD